MRGLIVIVCVIVLCWVRASEGDVFSSLNIPPDAQKVVVFGQASHLDWDWLNIFTTNVNDTPGDMSGIGYWVPGIREPTNDIFTTAGDYLSNPEYGYSIAEVGFLQSFQQQKPSAFQKLLAAGSRFAIVGGGITTPDSLLPHGEAFIRNFLVGVSWVEKQGVSWSKRVWVPDDFGHDSQLPVMTRAMGAEGIGFARLPGSCMQGPHRVQLGVHSAHSILLDTVNGGLDFDWQASDGSTVMAFYEPTHYDTGDHLKDSYTYEFNSTDDARNCRRTGFVTTTRQRIGAFLNVRLPVSKTPFTFVTTGSDFAPPIPNLLTAIDDWNSHVYPNNKIYAVAASLKDYQDMIKSYLSTQGSSLPKRTFHGASSSTSFVPTPYWMGYYTSRPILKILHYQATRFLLSVELLNVIHSCFGFPNSQSSIDAIWQDHVPSTHHDYVTGTSTDYVLEKEQIPLSYNVYSRVFSQRWNQLTLLASQFGQLGTGNYAFIFNPNGFPVSGVAVVDNTGQLPAVTNIPQTLDGSSLVYTRNVPALGYKFGAIESPSGLLRIANLGDQVVLENDFLIARISKARNWAIVSLVDKLSHSNSSIIKLGNQLEFRSDGGNIYRYGYEESCGFSKISESITPGDIQVLENSLTRIWVKVDLRIDVNGAVLSYTMEYTLIVGEPFLRIKTTGWAPSRTSILTKFQFPKYINRYTHGTPYHWDYKSPLAYGFQNDFKVTFEAVHDYIIPEASDGNTLGAIYHANSPAWGVLNDTLIGVILRNSPEANCANKGAAGSDGRTYTIHYAIRVPSGLGTPSTGHPLREARTYQNPPRAILINSPKVSSYPSEFSVGSSSPSSSLITSVKMGTVNSQKVVMRLYNPTNQPAKVSLSLNPSFQNTMSLATALEADLHQSIPLNQPFTVDYALSTYLLDYRSPSLN
eukprot:TRINITY_DN7953_c0_g1_i1.p1 TRINITY_DN7953_c0_g1~~TRINITY_DN7953_c0_g1_i1.p1  ORF type:complete len:917 (-),score=104.58 TRINITY_DN7953_c0_g1_i1:37-2787(-)